MNVTTSSLNFNNNDISQDKSTEYFEFRNFFKKIKKIIVDNCQNKLKPKEHYVNEPESNKDKKNTNKKRPIYIHILHVILFFISYFFYFISLRGCYDGEDMCSHGQTWIIIDLIELLISTLINAVLFFFMIYNKVSSLNTFHNNIYIIL